MSWFAGSGSGGGAGGAGGAVPTLKPGELFDKRKQRDSARLKAYNEILKQIYVRIRTVSKEGAEPWTLYTVPPFVVGLPKIDHEDCVVYLVYILRQQGYEVRFTWPNLLYISWKHHERQYILENSPVMKAMLSQAPKTKASEPRKAPGQSAHVRFQDEMMSGAHGAVGPRAGRAPPRSTLDYQPPTNFLDALEKPSAVPREDALKDFLMF